MTMRNQDFLEFLNKDKGKMSPVRPRKKVYILGIDRETWDFRSPGLCCQNLTASLHDHIRLPNQKTKPFV